MHSSYYFHCLLTMYWLRGCEHFISVHLPLAARAIPHCLTYINACNRLTALSKFGLTSTWTELVLSDGWISNKWRNVKFYLILFSFVKSKDFFVYYFWYKLVKKNSALMNAHYTSFSQPPLYFRTFIQKALLINVATNILSFVLRSSHSYRWSHTCELIMWVKKNSIVRQMDFEYRNLFDFDCYSYFVKKRRNLHFFK